MSLDNQNIQDISKENTINQDIEKKNIQKGISNDLSTMKLDIKFNQNQIDTFENQISKRFNINNTISKINQKINISNYDTNEFINSFENGDYDRYYTNNLEIKEITLIKEKEIKTFINNLNKQNSNQESITLKDIVGLIGNKTSNYNINYSIESNNSNELYQIDDSFKS